MIRGFFRPDGSRLRPFIAARLAIPSHGVSGVVEFLVDTGADSTLLAPADLIFLGVDQRGLAATGLSTGIGGTIRTATVDIILWLDQRALTASARVLLPGRLQQHALARIPSLLGRDILREFALFMEERSGRVLLLDALEADALPLP